MLHLMTHLALQEQQQSMLEKTIARACLFYR